MRNLPVPTVNDKNKFTDIINGKKKSAKERLKRIRPTVKRRYDEYQANKNQLELLPPSVITNIYAESLRHCYATKTKEMTSLRDILLEPDIDDFDECPFCGLSEPKTLDHYLPKEDFPEFSVYPKNLIPMCSVCNSCYKGVKCFKGGRRLFIHTYYDIFPVHDFLMANVDINAKISIEFSSVNILHEPYFSSLFNSHFKELGLNSRFKRKATAEIGRKRNTLRRIYNRNGSGQDVSDELRAIAIGLREEYGGNFWKVSLYDCLASNMDFCDLGFDKSVEK